jgi:hypothetical protein
MTAKLKVWYHVLVNRVRESNMVCAVRMLRPHCTHCMVNACTSMVCLSDFQNDISICVRVMLYGNYKIRYKTLTYCLQQGCPTFYTSEHT